MAAVLTHSQTEHFGLRPMDPMKDLRQVADLIEDAFAHDLDRSGQSALRELRWLSYLGPVLWWMVYFSPDHSDFLSGFVWEENEKITGNITVNRTRPGSRRWLISNVAVARDYRKRGIARSLMYAALELAREYNGSSVSLQVRADNTPAKNLYRSLNFKEVSGTTYLSLPHVPRKGKIPKLGLPKEVSIRNRKFISSDARQAHELARVALPLNTQKEWPLRQSHFQVSDKERITNFVRRLLGRGPTLYWVVEDGLRIISLANVRPGGFGRTAHIELIVHPDWRGYLEKPLISRALHYLSSWRSKHISVKHPAEHTEAVEAFKEFGFQEDQTLIWMKRDL